MAIIPYLEILNKGIFLFKVLTFNFNNENVELKNNDIIKTILVKNIEIQDLLSGFFIRNNYGKNQNSNLFRRFCSISKVCSNWRIRASR